MPKVFISHSWDDNDISKKLASYLKRDGAEIWIDYARISGGDSLPEVIGDAIEWCDTMVLVWSKSASTSYYVKLEWTTALANQKRVIPCVIDSTKLPVILSGFLYITLDDLIEDYLHLLRALKLKTMAKPGNSLEDKSSPGTELRLTQFRTEPETLSYDEVIIMLKSYDFYDAKKNEIGKGFQNNLEIKSKKGESVIVDHASSLMWQHDGSSEYMIYGKANNFIRSLNEEKYWGFSNWRLPTLEEAMSIVEVDNNINNLHIDPVFDDTQKWIWTSDRLKDKPYAWSVRFSGGYCGYYNVYDNGYVRAVRSGQSSVE